MTYNLIIKKGLQRFFVLSLFFLCSCSASFTYNNLDWLSSFWIDDYIDLNKAQTQQLKSIITNTRKWHRTTELPKYRQELVNLQTMFHTEFTVDELNEKISAIKQHVGNLMSHAQVPLVSLAKTLTLQQRDELVARIQEDIDNDWLQFNELSLQQHKNKRLDKRLDYFEDLLGSLSEKQVSLITAENEQYINTFNMWHQYKQNRLNTLAQLLTNTQLSEAAFSEQLGSIITSRDEFMSSELKVKNHQNQMLYINLLMELNMSLSKEQYIQVDEYFIDLIDTIDDLIKH